MTSSLSIDVFNSGYKPIPEDRGDDSTPATWPASTRRQSGDRDAVLVDALLTTTTARRWRRGCTTPASDPGRSS
jgi:hypothetical protein